MDNEESLSNYRTLLNLRENLRNRFSSLITNLLGFVIIANSAIWSFFTQTYVAQSDSPEKSIFALLVTFAMSSVTIGVWRLYTRHVDNQVAYIYPEILRYEMKLGVLYNEGIRGYIAEYNDNLKQLLSFIKDEDVERQTKVISELAKKKRIGSRGHSMRSDVNNGHQTYHAASSPA